MSRWDMTSTYYSSLEANSVATPLRPAVQKGISEIKRLVREARVNVNYKDKTGLTAMHMATEIGCIDTKQRLFKVGVTVNVKNGELISNHEETKIGELLLYEGAEIYASDQSGTMLHSALKKGYIDIVEMFLKRGAEVYLEIKREDALLYLAKGLCRSEICRLLLKEQVNVNAIQETYSMALHIAVMNYVAGVTETLLKYGADVNLKTDRDETLLHLAVKKKDTDKILDDIFRLLLESGPDVNAKDVTGLTALHIAIYYCPTNDVEMLLKHGADVNLRTKSGKTPLHLAVHCMNVEICELLLERGADVNALDGNGLTALHEAIRKCLTNVVEMLLKHGADVNFRTTSGKTPLHLAVSHKEVEICELLLERGAEVNAKDGTGSTVLHEAFNYCVTDSGVHISKYSNSYIVMLLLESGANVNMVNKFGKAVFQLEINRYVTSGIHVHLSDLLKMGIATNEVNLEDVHITSYNSKQIELIRKCEEEVQRMRSLGINKTNVTFHDILTESVDEIALYARNEDVVQALRLEDYQREFPEYAGLIKGRFNRGLVRKKLLDEGHRFFSRRFSKTQNLPFKCIDKILNYLSNWNLLCLEKACLF